MHLLDCSLASSPCVLGHSRQVRPSGTRKAEGRKVPQLPARKMQLSRESDVGLPWMRR